MTLRNWIAGAALALLLLCLLVSVKAPEVRPATIMLALVTAGILFENRRYRTRLGRGMEGLAPGKERFVDPETGRVMRVWTGPGGERRYIED